ncbi:hypothetical protein CR513_37980, partial [Mucuna pruriens]
MDPRVQEEQRLKSTKRLEKVKITQGNEQVTHLGEHLFVCLEAKSDVQRKRRVGGEMRIAMDKETTNLEEVGFIKEAKYTTWLSNVVLVKKSIGKWTMCSYYTNLNKAYPKNSYPLPSIDWLVKGASRYKVLNIIIFKIDKPEHVSDLEEIFFYIRKHNMRLNTKKCVFDIQGRSFWVSSSLTRELFLPKAVKKVQPFFQLLKKSMKFQWSNQCEEAFKDFKYFLASPSILTKPKEG